MELLPLALRMDVREFSVRELKFREITEIFEGSGIQSGTRDLSKPVPGVRRELIENYYASLDFTRVWDAHKFLSVISMTLSRMSISETSKAALRAACLSHGFEIEGTTARLPAFTSNSNIRNVIFASTGPKPEITMTDALTNSIQVISKGGNELIYDRPIMSDGLSWDELIAWWREKTHSNGPDSVEIERNLLNRLSQSLESEPERLLFRTHCSIVCGGLLGAVPALLPQVYLHYDAYTVKQLDGQKRLTR